MTLLEKLQAAANKGTVKAFQEGEAANDIAKKITKLDKKKDKTKEEEEQQRELRKEAERLRERQEQARQLTQGMGLGEKILRCYFTYKLASLACHTLVGLAGGYAYQQHSYAMANAVSEGIEKGAEKIADRIEENAEQSQDPDKARAEMIEQTLESFERMSEQAQEQGLTKEGEPLLTEEDKEKIQELAEISRDSDNPEQAQQYAAKCQELGLDYNEAMTAFQQDKTFDTVQNEVEKDRENQMKHEVPTMEMTV